MVHETDAADSLGESGSPTADRHLCENFGLTVKRVREFDPQTLDVTLACKFLGLPLKRYDLLATQPGARARWVESVAAQKKVLIELFPEASRELKEMLEAIRKFATRKCLKPDSPALLGGDGDGVTKSKSQLESEVRQLQGRTRLLVGGFALATVVVVGSVAALLLSPRGNREPQAVAPAGNDAKRALAAAGEVPVTPAKPNPVPDPPAAKPAPAPPPDPFAVNSVWANENITPKATLTVTARQGDRFTAKFVIGEGIEREVKGTVKGGQVSWLAKDVRVVRGANRGADNTGTIKSDPAEDKIRFEWKDKEGAVRGFTLHKPKTNAPAVTSPSSGLPAGVLTPAQALRGRAGDAVTVQYVVRLANLTPVKRLLLLNSEADHLDKANFTVVMTPKCRAARWKDATAATFQGQTVRAKGVLANYEGRLELLIDDEAAVTLVK